MVRLFVGGLPVDITAADLQARFTPFGTVQTCELIRPKSLDDQPSTSSQPEICRGFAYVDFLPKDDGSLARCLSLYNRSKWRGHVLRVEVAKLSYLDKLHQEWQEDKQNNRHADDPNDPNGSVTTWPPPADPSQPLAITLPGRRKKVIKVKLTHGSKQSRKFFPAAKERPLSQLQWECNSAPKSALYKINQLLQLPSQHRTATADGVAAVAAAANPSAAVPHNYVVPEPKVLPQETHSYFKIIKSIDTKEKKLAALAPKPKAPRSATATPSHAAQRQQQQQQQQQQQRSPANPAAAGSGAAANCAGVIDFFEDGDDDGGAVAGMASVDVDRFNDSSDDEAPGPALVVKAGRWAALPAQPLLTRPATKSKGQPAPIAIAVVAPAGDDTNTNADAHAHITASSSAAAAAGSKHGQQAQGKKQVVLPVAEDMVDDMAEDVAEHVAEDIAKDVAESVAEHVVEPSADPAMAEDAGLIIGATVDAPQSTNSPQGAAGPANEADDPFALAMARALGLDTRPSKQLPASAKPAPTALMAPAVAAAAPAAAPHAVNPDLKITKTGKRSVHAAAAAAAALAGAAMAQGQAGSNKRLKQSNDDSMQLPKKQASTHPAGKQARVPWSDSDSDEVFHDVSSDSDGEQAVQPSHRHLQLAAKHQTPSKPSAAATAAAANGATAASRPAVVTDHGKLGNKGSANGSAQQSKASHAHLESSNGPDHEAPVPKQPSKQTTNTNKLAATAPAAAAAAAAPALGMKQKTACVVRNGVPQPFPGKMVPDNDNEEKLHNPNHPNTLNHLNRFNSNSSCDDSGDDDDVVAGNHLKASQPINRTQPAVQAPAAKAEHVQNSVATPSKVLPCYARQPSFLSAARTQPPTSSLARFASDSSESFHDVVDSDDAEACTNTSAHMSRRRQHQQKPTAGKKHAAIAHSAQGTRQQAAAASANQHAAANSVGQQEAALGLRQAAAPAPAGAAGAGAAAARAAAKQKAAPPGTFSFSFFECKTAQVPSSSTAPDGSASAAAPAARSLLSPSPSQLPETNHAESTIAVARTSAQQRQQQQQQNGAPPSKAATVNGSKPVPAALKAEITPVPAPVPAASTAAVAAVAQQDRQPSGSTAGHKPPATKATPQPKSTPAAAAAAAAVSAAGLLPLLSAGISFMQGSEATDSSTWEAMREELVSDYKRKRRTALKHETPRNNKMQKRK